MTKQRKDEWSNYIDEQTPYHVKQWDEPKESTRVFYEFAKQKIKTSKNIIDLGAGAGAATSFIANKAPQVQFIASDFIQEYLDIGQAIARNRNLKNINFRKIDWFKLKATNEFDGVISLQTLSWLPEPITPLTKVFQSLKPEWFALTSLFYEGDISCTIETHEHQIGRKSFYNIYSLPEIRRIAKANRYKLSKLEQFDLPLDIDKPANSDRMSTYTKTAISTNGERERLQISGPLLMPWFMLLFQLER